MGAGIHEWPLMFFTVIGQSVAGAFAMIAIILLSGKLSFELVRKIHYSMFGLWLLLGIGFLLSTMHMGTPLRAFNAFNRLGSSSLSNEITSGALFFAFGGLYWLLAVLNKMPAMLGKIWLIVVTILAAAFIVATASVYLIPTVPTWNNNYTVINFVVTAFLGGPILAALLLRIAGFDLQCIRRVPTLCVIALLVSISSAVSQGFDLASIETSVQRAADLVPDYGFLMNVKIVAVAMGLGCWIMPMIAKRNPSVLNLGVGFLFVMVGEIVGRGVFYGLHMTVGMAVN